MKNWIYFLIALILNMIIHEGIHAIVALLYGEYHSNILWLHSDDKPGVDSKIYELFWHKFKQYSVQV